MPASGGTRAGKSHSPTGGSAYDDGGMDQRRPIREKAHRLPREHYLGERAIAFTACLRDRRQNMTDPILVEAFTERLGEAAARHRCTVPLYTFMPDHLHVLLLGKDEASDGKAAMDRFKASTGWWLYRNQPGVKWQKDYWDHIVRVHEGWESQARYIAGNPVRAGLVDDLFDWPYTGSIGYDVREVILDAHW
ncbi:MAG: hypothetical protein EOP84_15310 [Verrucomicrobiaceae bacterium]|nr:MAG: hypothetical protein EOP84_15310 [Verrucomicrobiaceae bacterium]